MKVIKVGVIILTYNSEKQIADCLTSLQKNTYKNFEILVVDNDSKDKTLTTIKKDFPSIRIRETGKNLGYAAGNNVGIQYFLKKNVEYILLLNPDTIVSSQLITKLVTTAEEDLKIGALGPIITYVNHPDKIWFAGGYFNQTFCYTRHPQMNKNTNEVSLPSGETDFITGACLMIRTKTLQTTDLLPEQYFLYFEDAFFCQKVKQAGYKNHLLAQALVKHHVSASTGEIGTNTLTPLRAYYFARNPLLYIKKEVHGLQKITNYIGQFTIRLPHYLLQMLKVKNLKSCQSYIKGIKDGLMNS